MDFEGAHDDISLSHFPKRRDAPYRVQEEGPPTCEEKRRGGLGLIDLPSHSSRLHTPSSPPLSDYPRQSPSPDAPPKCCSRFMGSQLYCALCVSHACLTVKIFTHYVLFCQRHPMHPCLYFYRPPPPFPP